jgi:hypothetical protein
VCEVVSFVTIFPLTKNSACVVKFVCAGIWFLARKWPPTVSTSDSSIMLEVLFNRDCV